jgi:hypothetical protein
MVECCAFAVGIAIFVLFIWFMGKVNPQNEGMRFEDAWLTVALCCEEEENER